MWARPARSKHFDAILRRQVPRTCLKNSRDFLAHASQRKQAAARSRPALAARARTEGDSASVESAARISLSLFGSTKRPPSPTISGRHDVFEAMTGTPAAIACAAGKPKPSYSDTYATAVAPAVKDGSSASAT